jgi:hypothetical protein
MGYIGPRSPPWGFFHTLFFGSPKTCRIPPWLSSTGKMVRMTSRGQYMTSYRRIFECHIYLGGNRPRSTFKGFWGCWFHFAWSQDRILSLRGLNRQLWRHNRLHRGIFVWHIYLGGNRPRSTFKGFWGCWFHFAWSQDRILWLRGLNRQLWRHNRQKNVEFTITSMQYRDFISIVKRHKIEYSFTIITLPSCIFMFYM